MKKAVLGIVLGVAAAVAPAQWHIHWGQQPDIDALGRISQHFPDAPARSVYQFDSFTIGGPGILLAQVIVYGMDGNYGDPSQITGYHLRFTTTPSRTAAAVGAVDLPAGGSVYHNGNLRFPGLAIAFAPGTYYITAWIDRPRSAGVWLWRGSRPVRFGASMMHNPGGGLGYGTKPIPTSTMYGRPVDLAFELWDGHILLEDGRWPAHLR